MDLEEHDHKHCLAMFEKLSEYIDGELDQSTRREIEAHLEICASCKICLATLKTTIHLCRGIALHPVPEALSQKLRTLTLDHPSAGKAREVYKR